MEVEAFFAALGVVLTALLAILEGLGAIHIGWLWVFTPMLLLTFGVVVFHHGDWC